MQNALNVPRFRALTMGPRLGPGRLSSEYAGLSGGLFPLLPGFLTGLLVVLPVLFGTCLAPGLVRDGGSPAFDTEPEGLGLLSLLVLGAGGVCSSLRSGLSSYSRWFCSSGFDLGRCGLHPGLWLDPGLRLLYFLAGAG